MKKLLILLILFLLSGCYNYNELNTLAITTAMSIDLTKDNKYEVSLLIASSKKGQTNSSENQSQTVLFSGKGNTISEALKEIDSLSSRQIYISHLSVVIISEKIAEKGISDVLDYFLKNAESTKRFQLAISKKSKAKDIIKIVKPLETFPSESVSQNIKISNELQAKSSSMLYSKFIYILLEKGINPVLPTISVKGDLKDGTKDESLQQTVPDALVELETTALFKKDKLIDYASSDESKGINILRNEIDQMYIYTKCKNDYSVIKIDNLETKIKYLNKLNFKVDVKSDGTIIESNCNIDLSKKKVINKIEKDTEKEIRRLINKGLNKTKKIKTDVFGFGNLIYKKNPKLFNKFDNWDNEFNKIDINLNIDLNLKYKGSSKQNLKKVLNEN